MTPAPRARAPYLYRLAFAAPLVALAYLLISGRWSAYFTLMRSSSQAINPDSFADAFLTGVIWIISIAPLMYLSWELGYQHTRARRLGFDIWIGLREAFRIAIAGGGMEEKEADFARAPTDRPGLAALVGLIIAAAVPAFFVAVVPALRATRPLIWLGTTGVLFGVAAYCHLRAAAYLVDEPPLSMFRNWARLNPARYADAGRPFVHCQIVLAVILPVWWIVGGMYLVLR